MLKAHLLRNGIQIDSLALPSLRWSNGIVECTKQFSGANVAELLPSLDASAPMPQHGHVHIKWQDVGRIHGISKKI